MLRFALYCLRETGTVGEEERVGKSRKRVLLRETLEEIQEENIKEVGESIRGRVFESGYFELQESESLSQCLNRASSLHDRRF